MTLPRYIENRPPLKERVMDDVDKALVAYAEAKKAYDKLKMPTSSLKEFNKYIIRLNELGAALVAAQEKIFIETDKSTVWIYRFQSPFGEAFVSTIDEAVDIYAKVTKRPTKKWREIKRDEVSRGLELIKLGVDGGTFGKIK